MIMGAPSVEPCNCCCDFGLTVTYSTSGPASVLVLVASTAARPTFTSCFVRIFRNGVLVVSVDNLTSSSLWGITVSPGQTVTATVTATSNPACSFTQSCTRYSVTAPTSSPCTPFNPAAFTDGTCYSLSDFYAGYQYNPHPITAVVSGLSGPMVSLNGTYTVDCEDPVAYAEVFWDGGASRGWVQIIWEGPYAVRAFVVSRVPSGGGFLIGGRDFESDYGTATKTVNIKLASCAACTTTAGGIYNTEGPVIVRGTGTGQPADGVSIGWTFG
jgi:hypothetical protein